MEKKTESLNQSGAFLQIHVLNELKKKGWETQIEIPRTVAPFVSNPCDRREILYVRDPNRMDAAKFPQAIAASQDLSNRQETSVDIFAKKSISIESKTAILKLCIEVKKNDPRYVDWCFFQHEENHGDMRVITKRIQSLGHIDLFKIGQTTNYGNEIFVQIHQFKNWNPLNHDIADFALALQNSEVKPEYFKSEKTRIDDSIRQIIRGTYGTIIEHLVHQIVTVEGYDNWPDVFIPIIVTNANLYLCKFDSKDIDSETGHIRKDPEYVAKDVIIYECPAPKEVQFPEPLSSRLDSERRKQVAKWHVLIMTPKGFVKFLADVEKI